MKTLYAFLFLTLFSIGANAQLTKTFTFEADDADVAWALFANGAAQSDDDVSVVANPNATEPNTSDKVLQFSVHADALPYVGMWTKELEEPMVFTDDAHIITMLVLKSTISPVDVKLEDSEDGGAVQETKIANTLVDEWELMTFDLTAAIGFSYTKLVIFPDFPDARTDSSVVFLDNISSPGAEETVSVKNVTNPLLKIFPNPTENNLFIQHPDMRGFSISNLSGQIVKANKFQSANSKFIDINNLKSGIYLITIESGSGLVAAKFLKK